MRRQLLEQFMTTVNIQGFLPLESGMYFLKKILCKIVTHTISGRDRMVVGFTTTYVIGTYHH
jgi:hypothetical protein